MQESGIMRLLRGSKSCKVRFLLPLPRNLIKTCMSVCPFPFLYCGVTVDAEAGMTVHSRR